MSILDDPCVQPFGGGFEVTTDAGPVRVLPNEALGWGLYVGDRLNLVMTSSGPAIGFQSAEAAIEAVLS
ncbi:hypothetical protein Ade02nite_20370 [Paractinoplanes deccanensis]|uniref:Uncharacterized protein n=1 Tax=Paractinoplanes deccanensis TaxID=113561 RepID=A0ABQ3Y074_9ACTN|nr:hypothetical protein [Actinoplanes deccanensis]GID73396.1 hypothetical protein Ade02nite_20370 [Actinoplanes deccanensis]